MAFKYAHNTCIIVANVFSFGHLLTLSPEYLLLVSSEKFGGTRGSLDLVGFGSDQLETN